VAALAILRKVNSIMEDRSSLANQTERPNSTLRSHIPLPGLAGPGFPRGGGLDVSPTTECEASTSTCGVGNYEMSLDSDSVWVAMLKHQNQTIASQTSCWQLFRLGATDLQRDEVEDANRRVFFESLRRSYAKRSDTIVWSMLVFIVAAIVLISVLGFGEGTVFAILVSLCWTAVHRVRRL